VTQLDLGVRYFMAPTICRILELRDVALGDSFQAGRSPDRVYALGRRTSCAPGDNVSILQAKMIP
jgi:hypothetical protein